MEHKQLIERLDLIEEMIAAGRRDADHWGWAFALWGVGHLVSLFASRAGYEVAWPIAMTTCGVVMGIVAVRRRSHKATTLGRALGAVWSGLGVSMFLVGMIGGISGRVGGTTIVALFFALMGAASFASSLILRWRSWAFAALLWWGATVAALLLEPEVTFWLFVAMAAVAEVGFGVYLMIDERREETGVEAGRA